MNFIEGSLIPAIKRPAGAGQQIRYAQTDDDRHERSDELEAAHEILRILHDEASLTGTKPGNRVTNCLRWA
jgi:hypothetical protein